MSRTKPRRKPAKSIGLKYDTGKLRFDLECIVARIYETAVKTFGAIIHGDNNWKQVENGRERYYAALERHLVAWRLHKQDPAKHPACDKESGLPHLAHALTCLNFIAEMELEPLSDEQLADVVRRAHEVKKQKERKH